MDGGQDRGSWAALPVADSSDPRRHHSAGDPRDVDTGMVEGKLAKRYVLSTGSSGASDRPRARAIEAT